jgi:hypothetical protein
MGRQQQQKKMTDADLTRIQEEAKRQRIAAANAALKAKLRLRQGASTPVPNVLFHPNCIVCGKPNPKGMARVCSGACYQQAPLQA